MEKIDSSTHGQPTNNEREEKIQRIGEVLKVGTDGLVVHGTEIWKQGKRVLALRPDLDAMGGLYLMDLAGINYSHVTSVTKGESVSGAIHIDTGEREDTSFEDDGSIFFDHHGNEEGKATSATALVYETLTKNGLLKKEKWLDEFVQFVTEIDNLSYKINPNYFENQWWYSLYGHTKGLSAETVANRFKKGKSAREPFAKEERATLTVWEKGKSMSLQEACDIQRGQVKKSLAGIDESVALMKKRGLKTETRELGTVVVNTILQQGKRFLNRIPLGFKAVRAVGYQSFVTTGNDGFFITSQAGNLELVYEKVKGKFPEAKLIRGTMIVCKPKQGLSPTETDTLLETLQLKEKK